MTLDQIQAAGYIVQPIEGGLVSITRTDGENFHYFRPHFCTKLHEVVRAIMCDKMQMTGGASELLIVMSPDNETHFVVLTKEQYKQASICCGKEASAIDAVVSAQHRLDVVQNDNKIFYEKLL